MEKSTVGGERLSFGPIERDGLLLSVDSRGLTLKTIEYHCPPAHLRREELRQLGLVLNGYVLARVRAGLDVFVTSCGAPELLVGLDELAKVGLRVRKTPLIRGDGRVPPGEPAERGTSR